MFGKKKETREFERECTEHLDALYAMAVKLTNDRTDADELVQDTYLRAFRFRDKFEWGTNLKAWRERVASRPSAAA